MAVAAAALKWLSPGGSKARSNKSKKPKGRARPVIGFRRGVVLAACLAGLAVISLVLVVGYQSLLTSSVFGLKNLTVTGRSHLSRAELVQLTGLRPGDNLLALNPETIKTRLMASPWLTGVTIRRVLPDELRIHVTERHPAVMVLTGRNWFVDSAGQAFKTVGRGENLDLPVVTGLTESDLKKASGKRLLLQVCDVVERASSRNSPLRLRDLSEIHVDSEKGLVLLPQSRGPKIILGRSSAGSRLAGLGRVKAHLKSKGLWRKAAYVDLRFKNNAYVGFKAG